MHDNRLFLYNSTNPSYGGNYLSYQNWTQGFTRALIYLRVVATIFLTIERNNFWVGVSESVVLNWTANVLVLVAYLILAYTIYSSNHIITKNISYITSRLGVTPSAPNYKTSQESWRVKSISSLTKIIERNIKIYNIKFMYYENITNKKSNST